MHGGTLLPEPRRILFELGELSAVPRRSGAPGNAVISGCDVSRPSF
jgi:hypothetical protein